MSHNDAGYPSRDCLVAVVNNDRDLDRFARDRCYRIPERAVGRAIGEEALGEIRTLALYQTHGVSGGLPGAVELWGEIAGIDRRLRREIVPDEPGHPSADEPYRLIRLASVERLVRPIVSRCPRRITFIRTTRGKLLGAEEINDLFIGTPAEEALWRSLRPLDAERRVFMTVGDTAMEVDFVIHEGSRALAVLCGERSISEPDGEPAAWLLLRFSPAELEVDMARCLEKISALVDRMRRETIGT